ncbi:MAG: hypothetical protein ABIE23_00865 [archaeon]|nr:hypothetical protein [Candidatus Micrarchaeota archaeon]
MSRGSVFSFDLMIAFLIVLFMVYLMFFVLQEEVKEGGREQLRKNGMMLIDSLVKNSDEENPLIGSCYFNPELKRVEENVLDYGLLKKINSNKGYEFVKEAFIETKEGKEGLFKEKKEGDCIVLKRFVLIRNEIGLTEKGMVGEMFCG